jgi:ABC-2 type transport system ATP-binding protein
MLLGLVPPTSGNALIDGYSILKEPIEVRKRVGLLPENVGFYDDLTARENLYFTAELNGITGLEKKRRVEGLLAKVGLSEWMDVEVGKFSRGMRQRLGIADALIKSPKVLMLDEPTAGIDPEGARHILVMVKDLSKKEGVTVLLSSHLLHQVQEICDRIGIMNKGRLVAVGAVSSLLQRRYVLEVELDRVDEKIVTGLSKIEGVLELKVEGNGLLITSSEDIRHKVSAYVLKNNRLILGMRVEMPSLDEIYMKYIR